jgi:hypothetical protein
MDKGANKIKGAIFACLGDCIVWNVLKIFLKYFKVGKIQIWAKKML